ncbi:MAG: hypothetical protein J7M38_04565 [Armatimonadetes bacterium]|nr:hypothetical protein [Armatimonadota bacterium]
MRHIPTLAVIALCVSGAVAGEKVMIFEEHTSVAPWTGEFRFEVPPFSIEHQVRLNVEARIDAARLSGSNHWLRIVVNGTVLNETALLNKPNEFRIQRGVDMLWVKGGLFRVLYSPDFRAAIEDTENGYSCPDADPYRFLLDITSYVHPGENTLQLTHRKVLEKPSTMIIRNVFVEVGRPLSRPESGTVAPAPTGPLPDFVPRGPRAIEMQVRLARTGTVTVEAGGRRFVITTRTSLPGGGWHETGPADSFEAPGAGETAKVGWTSGGYRIAREVEVGDDHVHVTDTVTNVGDTLEACMIEHHVAVTEAPAEVRLAGSVAHSSTMRSYNPGNPSVYAHWPDSGLGLVAEDDVLRVHHHGFLEPGSFGIADERLGLEPGDSVTLEWSIYPTAGGDYWDFVNAVRRNWGSNFTIPGPFTFNSGIPYTADAETLGKWARDRSLKIICGGIAQYADGRYAHGTGILFAPEFVERERTWIRNMRQGAPEVTPVCYFHAYCCTEPDGETKYADSRMINARGEHIGYPYRYRIPLYVPTLENSYGRALWRYLDTLLKTIGAPGVYWDEMSHSVMWYVYDTVWDGVSVTVDRDTHRVVRKFTSVPLITQPLRLEMVRYIRRQGGFLMANGQPATRTMHNEKIVRFVETGSYSAVDGTHLECPLGLGNHHFDDTPARVAEMIRNILAHGATWYGHHYLYDPREWDFNSVMFPITPVEIRAGMVIGEERIHTARSGIFGFADGAAADVYVVGGDGMRVADPDVTETVRGGEHRYEIRMRGDQFAILVKR